MVAKLDGFVGSVLALSSADNPYPVKLHAVSGTTKARIDGTLLDPLHLKSENVSFVLEGSDMAQLHDHRRAAAADAAVQVTVISITAAISGPFTSSREQVEAAVISRAISPWTSDRSRR